MDCVFYFKSIHYKRITEYRGGNMDRISISKVKKIYDGKTVLDIGSLEINKGEIVAVLGKNGSGKSTLIKIISGLLYQDNGEVKIFNLDNKDKNLRNITKFVQESGKGYYDYLSSEENIDYFLGLNKVNKKEILERLDDLVSRFEFKQHMDKKVSELSQGNRQKLSIIISLLTDPKILLLDEPTNGLDLVTSDFLLRNLKKISEEEKMTILLTTHDLNFINSLDVRCIILEEGKIIADDRIANLVKDTEFEAFEIIINNNMSKKLEALNIENKIRYSFNEDNIILKIYDKDIKDLVLENIEIEEYRKSELNIEDIYYKVINNE